MNKILSPVFLAASLLFSGWLQADAKSAIESGLNKIMPGVQFDSIKPSPVPGLYEVMEKRYPNSRRTYLRVKDVEVCGGDMSVISTQISTEKDSVFERLSATRKNVLQQAAIIGWGTLFKVLLRRITLQEAVQAVCKRVGLKGRAILCPYAEVGMDVDKPFQLEMMRQDLIKRVLE